MATEKQSEASEATRPTVAKEFVFDDDDHYYVDLSKVPMRSMIKEDELEGDSSSDQLSNSTTGDSSSDSDDEHQAPSQSAFTKLLACLMDLTDSLYPRNRQLHFMRNTALKSASVGSHSCLAC